MHIRKTGAGASQNEDLVAKTNKQNMFSSGNIMVQTGGGTGYPVSIPGRSTPYRAPSTMKNNMSGEATLGGEGGNSQVLISKSRMPSELADFFGDERIPEIKSLLTVAPRQLAAPKGTKTLKGANVTNISSSVG